MGQEQRIATAPWLTEWDQKMIAHLEPLAKANPTPRMQLLFFANTYPLVHHYALALRRAHKEPNKYIHLGEWKKQPGQDELIRYTNEKSDHRATAVSIFNPCWAFVPLSLLTCRLRHSLDPAPVGDASLRDFLIKAAEFGVKNLAIYAELAELGEYLQLLINRLRPLKFDTEIFHLDGDQGSLPMPTAGERQEDLLRLFIYGGSLSAYLSGKTNRYLRLSLSDEGRALPQTMTLYISSPGAWSDTLKEYHAALYEDVMANCAAGSETCPPFFAARSETCPPFYTVYRSYNELAWLLQHRSSFRDAVDFAKCVQEHHRPFGEREMRT